MGIEHIKSKYRWVPDWTKGDSQRRCAYNGVNITFDVANTCSGDRAGHGFGIGKVSAGGGDYHATGIGYGSKDTGGDADGRGKPLFYYDVSGHGYGFGDGDGHGTEKGDGYSAKS